MLQSVTATPSQLHVAKDPDAIFKDKVADQLEKSKADIRKQVRRAPIKRSELEGPDGQGYTAGCPKCDHAVKYGYGRGGSLAHLESCRERIYRGWLETDSGRERIARMGQRQLEYMSAYQELLKR